MVGRSARRGMGKPLCTTGVAAGCWLASRSRAWRKAGSAGRAAASAVASPGWQTAACSPGNIGKPASGRPSADRTQPGNGSQGLARPWGNCAGGLSCRRCEKPQAVQARPTQAPSAAKVLTADQGLAACAWPRPALRPGNTIAMASAAPNSEARPQDTKGRVTPVKGNTPTLPRLVTISCASSIKAYRAPALAARPPASMPCCGRGASAASRSSESSHSAHSATTASAATGPHKPARAARV